MAHAPVHRLNLGSGFQVHDSVGKKVEHLFTNLLSVVPVFEHIACRKIVPDVIKVLDQLVTVLVRLEILVHFGQRGCLKHVDDQHGMVSSQRASALCDDVRVGQIVLVGSLNEGVYAVVDILLNGVIDRAFARRRPRSVVVDAQSASTIHKVHVVSHLMKLDVELRSLAKSSLNASYLGDLRADVEVDEPQAVAHVVLVEQFQCLKQLRTGESEL